MQQFPGRPHLPDRAPLPASAPSGDSASPVGQRGRQRAILREGVYAINLALFVVITEDTVYRLPSTGGGKMEMQSILSWQNELRRIDGFRPVVVGGPVEAPDPIRPETTVAVDSIAIVTVHDGPSLAPARSSPRRSATTPNDPNYHNNYQDPEAFLRSGGRRGRQYVPLTDGTYFINRWFATIEMMPKTVVPIGYVGVVVSYYRPARPRPVRRRVPPRRAGRRGRARRLGTAARPRQVSVQHLRRQHHPGADDELRPALDHRPDRERTATTRASRSIDLVTTDAYEPMLPLSVVVHIDYQKAPSVIQRFGDVKKLITQTLDPMLSAYFRDVAHKKTMLELLHERDVIQQESREELRRKFREFDIECVDVLIGKPRHGRGRRQDRTLLEQLRHAAAVDRADRNLRTPAGRGREAARR